MLKSLLAVLLIASVSSGAVHAFAPCSQGQSEMSVESVQGIFCVDGTRICIANVSDGVCPLKQPGLAFGSYCGLVATNVYGCKTLTAQSVTPPPTTATPAVTPAPTTKTPPATTAPPVTASYGSAVVVATSGTSCPNGGAEMSVEGAQGVFCVKGGPLCAADVKSGLCPAVETPRLPLGSYCGVVASGVYGCKVGKTTGSISTTSASTNATSGSNTTTAGGSSASTGASTTTASSSNCPNGGAEMSVEGAQGVFCVKGGPLCAADVKSGLCPAVETPRLPLGSYCGVVASGVYGCKVVTAGTTTASPQGPSSTPTPTTPAVSTGSTGGAPASSAPLAPGSNCPVGESEVSVEAVKGFFCIPGGPICSGSVNSGLCPGKSDRLPIGAYCGVVASGVYGCKILNSQSVATPAPTTKAPTPSSAAPTPTPNASAIANTTALTPAPASADCPNGGSPMSIVGCTKVFCVKGDACAGTLATGNCPAADAAMGLPKGSYCDIVRPGVYGCKPIV